MSDYDKPMPMLWEQKVAGSNPAAPTSDFQGFGSLGQSDDEGGRRRDRPIIVGFAAAAKRVTVTGNRRNQLGNAG